MWTYNEDLEGWEKIIPNRELYLLSEAYGARVRADDGYVDDVTWFVDYSRMDGDDLESHRYVTTESMGEVEAQAWAEEVVR